MCYTVISLMGSRDQGHVEMFSSTPLSEGWSALYDDNSEDYLAFTFDPSQLSFMGICQIRDGWPDQGETAFTTILESCGGWPDRLDIAVGRGAHWVIPGQVEQKWNVTLHIGQGKQALRTIVGDRVVL